MGRNWAAPEEAWCAGLSVWVRVCVCVCVRVRVRVPWVGPWAWVRVRGCGRLGAGVARGQRRGMGHRVLEGGEGGRGGDTGCLAMSSSSSTMEGRSRPLPTRKSTATMHRTWCGGGVEVLEVLVVEVVEVVDPLSTRTAGLQAGQRSGGGGAGGPRGLTRELAEALNVAGSRPAVSRTPHGARRGGGAPRSAPRSAARRAPCAPG